MEKYENYVGFEHSSFLSVHKQELKSSSWYFFYKK